MLKEVERMTKITISITIDEEAKRLIEQTNHDFNLSGWINDQIKDYFGSITFWKEKEQKGLLIAKEARDSITKLELEKTANKPKMDETQQEWLLKTKEAIQKNPDLFDQRMQSYNFQFRNHIEPIGSNEFKELLEEQP